MLDSSTLAGIRPINSLGAHDLPHSSLVLHLPIAGRFLNGAADDKTKDERRIARLTISSANAAQLGRRHDNYIQGVPSELDRYGIHGYCSHVVNDTQEQCGLVAFHKQYPRQDDAGRSRDHAMPFQSWPHAGMTP